MPIRPFGGVVHDPLVNIPDTEDRLVPFISAKISAGLVTTLDPADIDVAAVADAQNVRMRFDKLSRRIGKSQFGGTKPNSNAILNLITFITYDNSGEVFRFTHSSVHKTFASWAALTGALTGTDANRIQAIGAFNSLVFTNGVDPIQVINAAHTSFAQLGDAPIYKYITVFDSRVVGAYLINSSTGNVPIQVGWSANGLITEWNPNTDISAGSSPIIDSPADNSDFITGVFGFTAVLIVLRERSLWLATKTGIATQPFSFYCDIPGIGCGCPYSAVVVPGGIIFADFRTKKVYSYTPGNPPTDISTPVELDIFANIQDPNQVFGSYNNTTNEYMLGIPLPNSTMVQLWIFNLRTQAWSYDLIDKLTFLTQIEGTASALTIDDLPGTIDSLIGTIDSLVNPVNNTPALIYGYADGTLLAEDITVTTDNGVGYSAVVQSKQFTFPVYALYVARLNLEFYARTTSAFQIDYSIDGGFTWKPYKTVSIASTNKPNLVQINKMIKCRKLTFRITSLSGDWDLLNYELHTYQSGPSRASSTGSV